MTSPKVENTALEGVRQNPLFANSVPPLVIDAANMHAVEQLALVDGGVLFRDFGEMTTERSCEFWPSFISAGISAQIFHHPVTRLPNVARATGSADRGKSPSRGVGAMTSLSTPAKTTIDDD
jgi:hypothetical protein